MNTLFNYLFETDALKICPEDKPFWYTSGKLGPYYINTHFLYGDECSANKILSFIDEELSSHYDLIPKLFNVFFSQYISNSIYKNVISSMSLLILKSFDINEIDYISGGERRDWFFSMMIAYILNKPHITIFKDSSIIVNNYNFETNIDSSQIEGSKVLHVSDLVTQASSYKKVWIPAIKNAGAKICWNISVVDRMQGADLLFEKEDISHLSLIKMDTDFFKKALELEIINKIQFDMIINFKKNPNKFMKDFLSSHPKFLSDSLNSNGKDAQRAKLCIKNGFFV